jgi:beta-phosphoglucomutase family hydrolase
MKLQIPDDNFEGYVFDCDGTLADTMPLHYEAWCEALQPYGCPFSEPYFYSLGGVPTVKIVEMLNRQHGLTMQPEETAKYKESLYLKLIPRAKPIQPVVDFALRAAANHKPIAVASGGKASIVRCTLTAIRIVDHFDAIVGAEDYVHGKPAPDPFLAAARKLGVDPKRCLAFEDTDLGLQSASSAGMATVRVPVPCR